MEVTQQLLEQEFRNAGISTNLNLLVHSSLRSLGWVEGGPSTVILALLNTIAPHGNLMMPTFTFSLPMWNLPPYELAYSPSRVGKITDTFWRFPDVLRSNHPTHSVAVHGPHARQLIEHHLETTPIGEHSPFDRLYQLGATILMLGTRQDTNSSLHLCEALTPVPYLNIAFTPGQDYETAWRKNERGEIENVPIYQVPGCSRGFPKAEPYLKEQGILREVKIADAPSQLLDLSQLVEAMTQKLSHEPCFLLCDNADCTICTRRRPSCLP